MKRPELQRRMATLATTCGIGAAVVWLAVVLVATAEMEQSGGPRVDDHSSVPDRYLAYTAAAPDAELAMPSPEARLAGGEATARAAAERRARLTEQMARVGVNQVVASRGGEGGVMADTLRGGSVSGDLDDVMAQVRGVGIGSAGGGSIGSSSLRGDGRVEKRVDGLDALLSGALGGDNHSGIPAPATALPRSGVVASSFVGGSGATARLEDLLDRGVVVDGRRIRLEAFADREPLPFPVPVNEAVAMYADLERGRVDARGDRVHLQIALVGMRGETPRRPRLDVLLVLDRSGSMSGEKWLRAVEAAHALVDRLAPDDRLGLVSYSGEATLDLSPARVGDGADAHAAVDAIVPGGSTNIGAALDLAASNAPRRRASSDLGLVVLVSDGQVTAGEASADVLGAKARAMFDASGVVTTAIGLGTDFDESTMLAIAREGAGSYHFVRRPSDVPAILTDELDARAQAVAQALRVKVVLGEGVVAKKVYGSRLLSEAEHAAVRRTEVATDARIARELGVARDRRQEADEGLRIHLPTFRRADQHVILIELQCPGGRGTAGVATVTLDYKDLASERNASVTRSVVAERSADREAVSASTNRLVKRTVLAFQAGEALQAAAEVLASGDVPSARRAIAERRELLATASELWRDRALARDAALLGRYERVLASVYPGWGDTERRTLELAMGAYGDRRMR